MWAEIPGRTHSGEATVAAQLFHLHFLLSNSRTTVRAELEPAKRVSVVPQTAGEYLFLSLQYSKRHIEPPLTFSRAGLTGQMNHPPHAFLQSRRVICTPLLRLPGDLSGAPSR